MIAETGSDWHREMAQAVTDPAELLRLLDLPPALLPAAQAAAHTFKLRVPRGFIALMERGNPQDPLLRQVWPISEELLEVQGFSDDPVGDKAALRTPGLLNKYRGRALIIASSACAVHCRYCFRRSFPYSQHQASRDHWRQILAVLRGDTELREVILSGGDPLALDDARLQELFTALAAIPHLRRLRIHTRLPVMIPERITPALVEMLRCNRLMPVVVLHINHPRELAESTRRALRRLQPVATLLNQSVLLRGVNDDLGVLSCLSEGLFDSGILPYYIHLLDRVCGAAHFEVEHKVARDLILALRDHLPGYLVPRLAREERGAAAKTLVV
jgi:EF-P beta-lysylation protein EpmB